MSVETKLRTDIPEDCVPLALRLDRLEKPLTCDEVKALGDAWYPVRRVLIWVIEGGSHESQRVHLVSEDGMCERLDDGRRPPVDDQTIWRCWITMTNMLRESESLSAPQRAVCQSLYDLAMALEPQPSSFIDALLQALEEMREGQI